MNTVPDEPRCFYFYLANLDTNVQVEVNSDGFVVIRASRQTFSECRRISFIRELAAEGFIGEEHYWLSADGRGRVQWVVDPTPFLPDAKQSARTRRIVLRFYFSVTVLWLVLLTLAALHWIP